MLSSSTLWWLIVITTLAVGLWKKRRKPSKSVRFKLRERGQERNPLETIYNPKNFRQKQ